MDKDSICIVGLGYVGLPLAVAFGKKNLKHLVLTSINQDSRS